MELKYGPYQLVGGTHVQDEPVRTTKIKEIRDSSLIDSEGRSLILNPALGVIMDREGNCFSSYLAGRKVFPIDIRPGDTVTLCKEVTYECKVDPRTGGFLPSEPFMSATPLDNQFSNKFIKPGRADPYAAAKIAEGDAEIARLRALLAEKGIDPSGKPPTPSLPALPSNLDRMSLKELAEYAAGEEIDLRGAKSADEARKILRAAATR